MDLSPGKELGRLQILSEIQAGGAGGFYRARDTKRQEDVGVRVMPLVNGHALQFDRRHHTAASLKHPNILTIRGLRSKLGISYIITEPPPEDTLRQALHKGPLPLARVIAIAQQLAAALSAAHRTGTMHGGLCPEVVLLDGAGHVKVTDFALVRGVEGPPEYRAPEQIQGQPPDPRSDLFSCGVMLYEMAVGARPFKGEDPEILNDEILRSTPKEPRGLAPAFVEILGRCLEKDPADRYQSAQELAHALENCQKVAPAESQTLSPAPRSRDLRTGLRLPLLSSLRFPRWTSAHGAGKLHRLSSLPRRTPNWPALLAVALVLLAGAVVYLWGRRGSGATVRFEPVTFRRGSLLRARFAPGKDIVYTALFAGSPQATYLFTPGSAEARNLELPEGSAVVSVSRQGSLAIRLENGALVQRSLTGETLRSEADNVLDADWSPDGESLAVARFVGPQGVYRIEYPLGKTLYESAGMIDLVRVSPDGERVAFTALDQAGRKLWVVRRTGPATVLTPLEKQQGTRSLSWSPDGSEIWIGAISPHERGAIRAVNLRGRVRQVTWIPEGHLDDVARDGRALVENFRTWSGLYYQNGATGQEGDLSWNGETQNVKLDAAGSRVFFSERTASQTSPFVLFARPLGGPKAFRIGDGNLLAVSPDGDWASVSRPGPPSRDWLLSTRSPKESSLQVPGLENQTGAVVGWLPNRRDYLIWGRYPGKESQHFVWNPDGRNLRAVTPEGTGLGLISDNGLRIAAQGPDRIWHLFSTNGGVAQPARGLKEQDRLLRWSRDAASIYVAAANADDRTFAIDRLNPDTGARTAWKQLRPALRAAGVSPAAANADGTVFVYSYFVAESELFLATGLQ